MYRNLKSATQRRNSQYSVREDSLVKVEEDVEFYAKKLQAQRRRFTNLNNVIRDLEKEVADRKEAIIKTHKSMDPVKNKFVYTKSLNAKKKSDTLHKKNDWLVGRISELKFEIDQLRRDRLTILGNIEAANTDIERVEEDMSGQHSRIEQKMRVTDGARSEIASMKETFIKEQSSFQRRFKDLKREFQWQILNNLKDDSHYKTNKQFDNFDTATLLKRQLQSIIINNKEKIRMIDSYQRNMKVLDEAFNTIKQTSGLTNINQIEAIFVKSEEQNCALLTYLDMLNQQIDTLTDNNRQLERVCEEQKKQNEFREDLLSRTPQDQIKRQKLNKEAKQKLELVSQVGGTISKISSNITQSIGRLRGNQSLSGAPMTRFNYERYLGEIDECIAVLIKRKARQFNMGTTLIEKALKIDSLPDVTGKVQSKITDPVIDNKPEPSNTQYTREVLQKIAKEYLEKPIGTSGLFKKRV